VNTPIISADSHIDLGWLPPDLFTSRVPSQWKERAPKIVETDHGQMWVADGVSLSGVASVGSAGRPYRPGRWKRADRFAETALFTDGLGRPANPEERWRDQDRDGVSAEVLYGLFGVSARLADPALGEVVDRAFNDWLSEFCASRPDRYIGLALLPAHDAAAAANELRRGASLGLRGGVIDVKNGYRPLWHRDWDPLWEAAQDLDLPISFHASKKTTGPVGDLSALMQPPVGERLVEGATAMSLLQFEGSADYFSIIFGGALDRYPRLTIVLAESGIGWIPSMLERMDWQYANEFSAIGLELKPSEYWRRQMYATFQWDSVGMHLLEFLGADRVMYASDYPHPDGTWPDSRQVAEQHMAHLAPDDRKRVLHDNAADVYHVGATASR
jgi:predicted TIM-barrel fold metal-dependent hydrolase